jgi:hypothetical protein
MEFRFGAPGLSVKQMSSGKYCYSTNIMCLEPRFKPLSVIHNTHIYMYKLKKIRCVLEVDTCVTYVHAIFGCDTSEFDHHLLII